MTFSEIWSQRSTRVCLPLFIIALGSSTAACSDDGGKDGEGNGGNSNGDGGNQAGTGSSSGNGQGGETQPGNGGGGTHNPLEDPSEGPAAGYPDGSCDVPTEAGLEDSSNPTTVVGDGTPESCTSEAFVSAVAGGGVITFDCGSAPHTISLEETAKVVNDSSEKIVIDGGGLVTLSGGGKHRILYMNTCDPDQKYTTAMCQNQDHPQLTVQNLTFADGNSTAETEYDGGGAIWVRGGRFKAVNTRFFNNVCASEGQDLGGGAIRVTSQYEGLPVYIVNSTFGGSEELGNSCSNGGALSSISVSWTIINSLFSHNEAIGVGGNPKEAGTPGGGSGGAIYNDGKTMTLSLCGSLVEKNTVNSFGSGIFFVSNDKTGDIVLTDTTIRNNCGGSWYQLDGISKHAETPVAQNGTTTLAGCE